MIRLRWAYHPISTLSIVSSNQCTMFSNYLRVTTCVTQFSDRSHTSTYSKKRQLLMVARGMYRHVTIYSIEMIVWAYAPTKSSTKFK